jgi:hypothetical protein
VSISGVLLTALILERCLGWLLYWPLDWGLYWPLDWRLYWPLDWRLDWPLDWWLAPGLTFSSALRCGSLQIKKSQIYRRIQNWNPTPCYLQSCAYEKEPDEVATYKVKKQCCGSGSGSTCFWASWIRIWILLTLSKNSKKNLDFYCFVTSF